MANTDNPNSFRYMRRLSGQAAPVLEIQMDTDATVAYGDMIFIDTDGYGSIAASTTASVLGMALESVTATSGTRPKISYIPALKDVVFSGQCSGTFALTDIGEEVDMEGTTGAQEVNENASSVDVFKIIGVSGMPNNSVGANTRVDFIVNKSQFTG
jgi:hypothetical protein